jgi:dephospho-CoA kinase
MINENENTIVIVGAPASGKTTLANKLMEEYPDSSVYHTDDYIKHGFEDSLYVLMKDLAVDPNKKQIIEGVQAARLLRKGAELNNFHADLVITIDAPEMERMRRYSARSGGTAYPTGMAKSINKVFGDYKALVKRMPRFVEYNT